MSSVSKYENFGKDFGLIHEAIIALRRVFIGRDFWKKIVNDESFADSLGDLDQEVGFVKKVAEVGRGSWGVKISPRLTTSAVIYHQILSVLNKTDRLVLSDRAQKFFNNAFNNPVNDDVFSFSFDQILSDNVSHDVLSFKPLSEGIKIKKATRLLAFIISLFDDEERFLDERKDLVFYCSEHVFPLQTMNICFLKYNLDKEVWVVDVCSAYGKVIHKDSLVFRLYDLEDD